MKGFWKDFKAFLQRGNVVDLAVAVVVGGAFGKIVTSLVNDIIMPLISLAIGGASVSDWKWVIKEATYDEANNLLTAETALHYGAFIQTILDFLIIAFFIFLAIRIASKIASASSKGLTELKDKATKTLHLNSKHKKDNVNAESNATETAEAVAAENEKEATVAEVVETVATTETATTDEETKELLKQIRDLLKVNLQQTENAKNDEKSKNN